MTTALAKPLSIEMLPIRARSRLMSVSSIDQPRSPKRRFNSRHLFFTLKIVQLLPLLTQYRPILWTQRMSFSKGKKAPLLITGSSSEPPVRLHNTSSTTAKLSAWNGTSTTLDQHNACRVHNYIERTRSVVTTSGLPSQNMLPVLVPPDLTYDVCDTPLTYISDDVVLFWQPLSVLS